MASFIGISSLNNAISRIFTRNYDASDLTNLRNFLVANMTPAGTVVFIASNATLPDGWLYAEGGTFDQTIYADLYAALGNSNQLPDLRNRIPIGSGSIASLKEAAGAQTATLSAENLPAHTHSLEDHTHTFTPAGIPLSLATGTEQTVAQGGVASGSTLDFSEGTTGAANPTTTGSAGTGSPFSIIPLVIGLRPIIKA